MSDFHRTIIKFRTLIFFLLEMPGHKSRVRARNSFIAGLIWDPLAEIVYQSIQVNDPLPGEGVGFRSPILWISTISAKRMDSGKYGW